jgi:hypothetical protein
MQNVKNPLSIKQCSSLVGYDIHKLTHIVLSSAQLSFLIIGWIERKLIELTLKLRQELPSHRAESEVLDWPSRLAGQRNEACSCQDDLTLKTIKS